MSVNSHPVIKKLFQYRQLLQQLEGLDQELMSEQIDKFLALIKTKQEISASTTEKSSVRGSEKLKQKKTLKVLQDLKKKQKLTTEKELDDEIKQLEEEVDEQLEPDLSMALDSENALEEKDNSVGDEKRAITYQMAKNKGLTPRRKKEQRNPRVKHRNKFRKAKIARRGQVRHSRQEIPHYAGEPSGIKVGLIRSIKLK